MFVEDGGARVFVEDGGARVFVDTAAATVLGETVLDAEVDADGNVELLLTAQPR